ncbi:hypothetical protein NOCA1170217 [metagenome]|uniref:Uncharacterized protein n=1 Tax=metagenome TaxID=256318 RepID=A0A2P2CBM9_9ZZZZ
MCWTPLFWAYWPVASWARAGQHSGCGEMASVNSIPSSASSRRVIGMWSRSSSRMSSVRTNTTLGRGGFASAVRDGSCVVWTRLTASVVVPSPLAVTVARVATSTTSRAAVIDRAHPRIYAIPSPETLKAYVCRPDVGATLGRPVDPSQSDTTTGANLVPAASLWACRHGAPTPEQTPKNRNPQHSPWRVKVLARPP